MKVHRGFSDIYVVLKKWGWLFFFFKAEAP